MNIENGRSRSRLRGILLAAAAVGCLAPLSAAQAGVKIPFGDGGDSWISVGLGVRASVTYDDHSAPDGSSSHRSIHSTTTTPCGRHKYGSNPAATISARVRRR